MDVKKYRDVIAGAFFLIVAAILYTSSFSIITSIPGRLGAEFMPRVVAATMAILSVILIITGIRPIIASRRTSKDAETKEQATAYAQEMHEHKQVLLMLLVVAIYIFLLGSLGFVFSSMGFLFAMMNIMSAQKKKPILFYGIIALVSSVGIYYLFRFAFHLYLPAGIYPF